MLRTGFVLAGFIPALFGQAQQNQIFGAAARGDLAALKTLIQGGVDVHSRNAQGRTALHEAAANCQLQAVRILMEAGGDMLARDNQGMKPSILLIECTDKNAKAAQPAQAQNMPWSLPYAAARKQATVVSMLLTMGANPNALGPEGTRALEVASLKGDAAIARILLDHGANPNLRSQAGSTPLHDAALNGNKEVIELLLAHGAELNALDADSMSTPLHFAASFGRLDAVKMLVEHGADVDAKNAKGQTALQLAISNEQKDVAAFLRPGRPN